MTTVGAFDAKTHLPALLERAAKGEEIQITRRGIPIAVLGPVDPSKQKNPRLAVQRIREGRKGVRLGGVKIRRLVEEGRRY